MEDVLKEFGLNEREAKMYIALLKEISCTASKLAKITKMNRTTAYLELENLMRKGLVSYVIKESKRYYQAAPPEKILALLENKKRRFEDILPKLKQQFIREEPFKIEVFEGKEGIKTFYHDIYNTGKEFLVFGATGKATEVLKYSYPNFLKKFTKANIKERVIANIQAKEAMETHPKTHFKVKYLPGKYKSEVTTIIYGNKIAIQSLHKENIYVVIIKDKYLHKSYKKYFEFMWSCI
ncbi:hypothetical protein HYS47_02715 [Candidatus Woesearchaeota archaeon]|nr:hypothetical protein [Candidatus Woesearchaeota archaeon]